MFYFHIDYYQSDLILIYICLSSCSLFHDSVRFVHFHAEIGYFCESQKLICIFIQCEFELCFPYKKTCIWMCVSRASYTIILTKTHTYKYFQAEHFCPKIKKKCSFDLHLNHFKFPYVGFTHFVILVLFGIYRLLNSSTKFVVSSKVLLMLTIG